MSEPSPTPVTKHHPEQGDDEIYLGNTSSGHYRWGTHHRGPGWKTTRRGTHPLMANGDPYTGKDLVPCFVKRSEIQAALDTVNAKPKMDVCDKLYADAYAGLLAKGRILDRAEIPSILKKQ